MEFFKQLELYDSTVNLSYSERTPHTKLNLICSTLVWKKRFTSVWGSLGTTISQYLRVFGTKGHALSLLIAKIPASVEPVACPLDTMNAIEIPSASNCYLTANHGQPQDWFVKVNICFPKDLLD